MYLYFTPYFPLNDQSKFCLDIPRVKTTKYFKDGKFYDILNDIDTYYTHHYKILRNASILFCMSIFTSGTVTNRKDPTLSVILTTLNEEQRVFNRKPITTTTIRHKI